jgi:hypothetical protein
MKDAIIIRMAEETSKALSDAHPFSQCPHLLPSYNALLRAAQANHGTDPFLGALTPIQPHTDEDSVTVAELRALLAQIRIALESLRSDGDDSAGSYAGGARPALPVPDR